MRRFTPILLLIGFLLALGAQPSQADWYLNPLTGKLDYYEAAPAAHAASHAGGGADPVDHDTLLNYVAGEHLLLPNIIATVLTDHDLAAHTGLGLAITSHAMSTHSDEDTYNISTSGSATVIKGYIHGAETTATPNAAFTVDWTAKQVQRITITGVNLDVTFTDPAGPCRLCLVVVQGDGDDTIDWANEASILWPGATDPTLSTTTGYVDVVTFYYSNGVYHGVANYDFR